MQILMDEKEFRDIQRVAKANSMTVAEWVRQALRVARRAAPAGNQERKFEVVREAVLHEFPVADIGQILSEIERGYLDDKGSGE
jgi:hypothetical protein